MCNLPVVASTSWLLIRGDSHIVRCWTIHSRLHLVHLLATGHGVHHCCWRIPMIAHHCKSNTYHKQELTPITHSANLVNMTTTGDEITHAKKHHTLITSNITFLWADHNINQGCKTHYCWGAITVPHVATPIQLLVLQWSGPWAQAHR